MFPHAIGRGLCVQSVEQVIYIQRHNFCYLSDWEKDFKIFSKLHVKHLFETHAFN